MKKLIFVLLIIGILTIPPLFLVYFLDKEIFSFASGGIESWITFWGSYIGAIIGASVVYFVARLQIKKQYEQQMILFQLENKQQIKSIEIENMQSTKREMNKFYLTNKLEKIEEMLRILEKLSSIAVDLNNDLVTFSITKEAIDRDIKSRRKEDPEDIIYELRNNLRKRYFEITKEMTRLLVLSEYVPRTYNQILKLQDEFISLYNEVRECYYSDDKYKKYLTNPDTRSYSIDRAGEVTKLITCLSVYDLHEELKEVLTEIRSYMR